MRTMEAIEGKFILQSFFETKKKRFTNSLIVVPLISSEAQPALSQKDKSPWRKSSLNVQSSVEDNDSRYSRRLRSRLNPDLGSSTLQVRSHSINYILFINYQLTMR